MEYTATEHWRSAFGRLDNRHSVGDILDSSKNANIGGSADVDPLDHTAFAGGSVDGPLLESAYAACLCLYAGIGRVAVVVNVI